MAIFQENLGQWVVKPHIVLLISSCNCSNIEPLEKTGGICSMFLQVKSLLYDSTSSVISLNRMYLNSCQITSHFNGETTLASVCLSKKATALKTVNMEILSTILMQ